MLFCKQAIDQDKRLRLSLQFHPRHGNRHSYQTPQGRVELKIIIEIIIWRDFHNPQNTDWKTFHQDGISGIWKFWTFRQSCRWCGTPIVTAAEFHNKEKIVFQAVSVFFFVLFCFCFVSFFLQKNISFWRMICSFCIDRQKGVFQCTTLTLTSPWIAIIPPHNSDRIVSRIFAIHCPLYCLCNSGDTWCIGNKNSLSLSLSTKHRHLD